MLNNQQIMAALAIISNDEASSDEELIQHFITELKMSEADARDYIKARDLALSGGLW